MSGKPGRQRPRPAGVNTVVEYDPKWPLVFALIEAHITPEVAHLGASIVHVGSTSIPGMPSKPIVDVDVVVQSRADVQPAIDALSRLGYSHVELLGLPDQDGFDAPETMPYHHLYVVVSGSKPHADHCALRDYLRSDPAAAGRYARRKLEVAHLITAESRVAYADAKSGVIEALLAEARSSRSRLSTRARSELADVVASVRIGDNRYPTERVTGGMNNEIYAVTAPNEGRLCCKLYKQDGRGRSEREWAALQTLDRHNIDFVPKPVHFEPNAIVMTWVEGTSLGGADLTAEQLDALFRAINRLYALPASDLIAPVTGPPEAIIRRVRQLHARADATSPALAEIGRWLLSDEPTQLAAIKLNVLGRGDPNLANCLWHEGRIGLIDWEYFGRTARAYELADHVEHLQARNTTAAAWDQFIGRFELSDDERRAHEMSRRLLAAYWLLLLQPGQRGHDLNPPGTVEAQEQRVLGLLG